MKSSDVIAVGRTTGSSWVDLALVRLSLSVQDVHLGSFQSDIHPIYKGWFVWLVDRCNYDSLSKTLSICDPNLKDNSYHLLYMGQRHSNDNSVTIQVLWPIP